MDDRILSSSGTNAVLGKDIEGNLSYSVVAPLEEELPGHSPRLGDGVPRGISSLYQLKLLLVSPPVTKKSWPMLTPFKPDLAAGRRPASFQVPGLV